MKSEWFNDQLVKDIIKDLDGCTAIKDFYIESPVFGAISPQMLGNTTKALVLMYKCSYLTNLVFIGDNGAKWLYEISKKVDIFCICSNPYIDFFDVKGFNAFCLNNMKPIKDNLEFIDAFEEFVAERNYDEHETDLEVYTNEISNKYKTRVK